MIAVRIVRLPEDGSLVVVPKCGYNGSFKTAVAALRYLAENPRPAYGQQEFNSEHLHQTATEIEKTLAARPPVEGVEVTKELIWEGAQAIFEFAKTQQRLSNWDELRQEVKNLYFHFAAAAYGVLTGKQKERG